MLPSIPDGFFDMQACANQCSYRKVALLFLSMGPIPHERMWTRWLQQANGLLPLEVLKHPMCTEDRLMQLQHSCEVQATAGRKANSTNPSELQYLFSIYHHSAPDYPGEPEFHTACALASFTY